MLKIFQYRLRCKKAGCLLSLIAVFLAALLIYPVVSVSRRDWPAIQSSEALRHDSLSLMQKFEEPQFIPQAEWPKSISELNPVSVYMNTEYVEITISSGGIGRSWGYVVLGESSGVDSSRFEQAEGNGIYRFTAE